MGLLTKIDQKLELWRGERATGDTSQGGSDTSSLVLQVLAAGLLAATLVIVVMRLTGLGTPEVVVFDVIKYANAQRAVASKFLVDPQAADEAAPLLLELSKRARETINEVAGPNTLVVLRQAVVQGETRDITDEVLTRLGLPTDVPTANPSRLVLDIAPTILGAGPRIEIPDVPTRSGDTAQSVLP